MNSILITGCNRGLGLGLVKCLVKDRNSPPNIIATCRNLEKAEELREKAKDNKNLHILQLDLKETATFADFASKVQIILKGNGLNILLNNAGYSPKSTRINLVKPEQMMETFQTNTVGPLMLTKTLLPLLKKASDCNKSQPLGSSRAVVVNMSSILASISMNDNGGVYPYRCSKVALNMATKSLSIDLETQGILVISIHPGWVKTEMGGPKAPMDIETSVAGILNVVRKLTAEQNGGFYQWNGTKLEW